MINALSNAYINQLSTHTHIFEGTIELLEYLKPKYRLHIITNGFENVQQKKIVNAGLAPILKLSNCRKGVKNHIQQFLSKRFLWHNPSQELLNDWR